MPKLKRNKNTRKHFSFFCVHSGFREPYKVLVDGNFLHAARETKVGEVAAEIPKLLGGTCKVAVTKCITAELKSLGQSFRDSATASKQMIHFKCSHETPIPAADCVQSLVGDRNLENLIIATQDAHLKGGLLKSEGIVPVLFVTPFGIQLEPPSKHQKNKFLVMEKGSLKVPEHERAAVGLAQRGQARSQPTKRKEKGANPLSCKKRKTESPVPIHSALENCDVEVKHKRKRQRYKKKLDKAEGFESQEASG
mmetsp:Transcript_22526/g.31345  ORF Transcript_22526/g.31345 Transcript_22526/m.31345 type:complete len:252 (-) Transcript_22526:268-1023(-)|eukprot:CAMPEP_0196588116 /NCGR_PEP_ID=MMETSP1081-20130531/59618_1 /TAXON_ID=36882 /ORGANISM="Pyramimonas amylifera, Strain CCMP720" /LENGTH=251 /DNA_ID=CAMNT_0041910523 /DNA_START=114 /DNA_END=869 /DNA_ORIENTATION=+